MRFSNSIKILKSELPPAKSDFKGAPAVPTWEQLADAAVAISNDLFDQLEKAFAAGATLAELDAIRKQIDELGDQVRAGAVAIGLIAPWKPKERKTGTITFALSLDSWFPWLKRAVNFIFRKEVVSPADFKKLTLDQQQAAFTAPGIEDKKELSKIRDAIAKGAETGESLQEFRKRIGDELALTRAQTETVYRTNTHQGYIVGFDKSMKSKAVNETFPAVMYSATMDGRTRDTHWALDGFVTLRTDPAYKILLRALKDWNCILPGGTVTGQFLCAVKSFYEGQAVEIETLQGAVIRVTKNHPILTANGFVPAGELNGGEQLFLDVGQIEESRDGLSSTRFGRWTSQKYDVPTKVEEVFGSLAALGFEESLRPIADNFHGEAACFNGNVRVVWANRELLDGGEIAFDEDGRNVIFEPSLQGGMSAGELGDSIAVAHSRPFQGLGLVAIPGSDAVSDQSAIDGATANLEGFADGLGGFAFVEKVDHVSIGDVFPSIRPDRVTAVRHFGYSGEVYDFQTTTGIILLGGLAIGNCRCSLIPLTLEDAEAEGLKTIKDIPAEVLAKYGT